MNYHKSLRVLYKLSDFSALLPEWLFENRKPAMSFILHAKRVFWRKKKKVEHFNAIRTVIPGSLSNSQSLI